LPAAIGSNDFEIFRKKLYGPKSVGKNGFENVSKESPSCITVASGLEAAANAQACHPPKATVGHWPMDATIMSIPWWLGQVEDYGCHYPHQEAEVTTFSSRQDHQLP